MVPPVPTPATKMSTAPSVSSQSAGAGGRAVDGGVRGVRELPGDDALRRGARELLGRADGARHALGARREHELGAVGAHEAPALDAHGLGHDDDRAVAAHGRERGERHAGVARGGLDDGVAVVAADAPRGLRVVEHGARGAVLGGAGGVGALELDDHARGEVVGALDVRELHEGSASDAFFVRGIDGGHGASFDAGLRGEPVRRAALCPLYPHRRPRYRGGCGHLVTLQRDKAPCPLCYTRCDGRGGRP